MVASKKETLFPIYRGKNRSLLLSIEADP